MTLWRNQTWKHISRYEYTIASSFGVWPLFVLLTILHTYYHANIDYLRNWQTFIITCGITVAFFCTMWSFSNYLWINVYGFFPPIPFGGYTSGNFMIPVVFATLWFMIPKKARKEKELKRRFVIFLVSRVYDLLVAYMYAFITLFFILIPSDYQPILGFVCPLIREILVKTLNFITYRAGGGRRVKMGKYFLKTASGSGSNITQGQLQITLIFETSREIKKSYEHLQKLY